MSKKENEQRPLFQNDESWREHWKEMPEFVQEDLKPYRSIVIHFETKAHMRSFAALLKQEISDKTKSLWYPELTIERIGGRRYVDASNVEIGGVDEFDEP